MQEEENKIAEILAKNDRQLDIEAVESVLNSNIAKEKFDVAKQFILGHIIKRNIDKYPIDIDKQIEERRKYTQSYRNAIKEREDAKRSIRQKINKGMTAYKLQEVYHNTIIQLEDIKTQEVSVANMLEIRKRRTFLEAVIEEVGKLLNENKAKETNTEKESNNSNKPNTTDRITPENMPNTISRPKASSQNNRKDMIERLGVSNISDINYFKGEFSKNSANQNEIKQRDDR